MKAGQARTDRASSNRPHRLILQEESDARSRRIGTHRAPALACLSAVPLEWAEAEIQTNIMAVAQAIRLPGIAPVLRFLRRQEVAVWGLQRV